MGKMYVTFHGAGGNTTEAMDKSDQMPVPRLSGAVTEAVTTSATSAKTTKAAPVGSNAYDPADGGFVTVQAVGANVCCMAAVTASATAVVPAASPSNSVGYPVLSGQSITFAIPAGFVVAGIEFT